MLRSRPSIGVRFGVIVPCVSIWLRFCVNTWPVTSAKQCAKRFFFTVSAKGFGDSLSPDARSKRILDPMGLELPLVPVVECPLYDLWKYGTDGVKSPAYSQVVVRAITLVHMTLFHVSDILFANGAEFNSGRWPACSFFQ